MQIIAHRGARYDAPENTLWAFQEAFNQQSDGIEVDVRMTVDEQLVLFHDDSTGRMAKKNLVVSRSTLEELKQLDVGSKKFNKPESIPALDELIRILPPSKQLIVEIKGGGVKTLEKLPNIPNSVLAAFSLQVLKEAKQLFPNTKAFWVHDLHTMDDYALNWLLATAQECRFDGLSLSEASATESVVAKIKKTQLEVYVWTVNVPQSARRLERWGIDGVITDKPGYLRQEMQNLL